MSRTRKPQNINKRNWYYEEPDGIEIIHEVRDSMTGDYVRTESIKIPWKMIRASLKRHDHK